MDVLAPPEPPPLPDAPEAASGALARPLGHPALDRFLEPGDRVIVAAPPLATTGESLRFAVEAILAAARRAGVASIAVHAAPDADAPRVEVEPASFGRVRVHRAFAGADRIVAVSGIAFDPLLGFEGSLAALLRIAADPSTRDRAIAAGALREFADRLGPVFSVEVAFQRGGRPSAIFAGEPSAAHRAARAYWSRWRGLAVGPGYEGAIAEVQNPRARDAAASLLLAARAVRPGGVVALAGPTPDLAELSAPLTRAVRELASTHSVVYAPDLEQALRVLRRRLPEDGIAHVPDPLRTLPSIDVLPNPGGERIPSAP